MRRITLMGGIRMFDALASAAALPTSCCSDAQLSAPDARAYFLFYGKKKVAKGGVYRCRRQKATPRSAPGYARSLALLGAPGGCGTRPCGPQTVLADFPRHACVAQRLSGGPRKPAVCDGLRLKERCAFSSDRFAGPLGRRRATQALAEKGRALSEGRSPELRSPRQRRVAQGTRAAGADLGVAFFLATFSWPNKKKYARASGAEHSVNKTKAARRKPRKSTDHPR